MMKGAASQMSRPGRVEKIMLNEAETAVLKGLLYFDIFQYPLKEEEVRRFTPGLRMSPETTREVLDTLQRQGMITCYKGYYYLSGRENPVERRETGNLKAQVMMGKAKHWARFIARFPFVRGVCISGSLSKGFIDEKGDIDYFIITEPGRLWLARTLLILFKKLFLFNNRKYFCVNYFVDTDHLEIPDRNIFTATELYTLIPMQTADSYEELIRANAWINELLPNQQPMQTELLRSGSTRMQKGLELIFSGGFGHWLDQQCMRLTLTFWGRKFGHLEPAEKELVLRSRKYVSKHHPSDFQTRILNRLEQQIREIETNFGISLKHG